MIKRTERIGWTWTFIVILLVTAGILIVHVSAEPVPLKATIVVQPAATVAQQEAVPGVATAVIADDITPYHGPVGPSSVLYGLKLSIENIDESFTPSQSERIEKQLAHANLRIAEARAELTNNRTSAAEIALEQYQEKMTATTTAASSLAPHETGLLHAQEMVAKHQYVLEQLLTTHQDNTGIQNAYANSVQLETAFIQKTDQKLERRILPDNRLLVQVVKVESPLPVTGEVTVPATQAPLETTGANATLPYVKPTTQISPGSTHRPQDTPGSGATPTQTPQPTPTLTPGVTQSPPQVTTSPTTTPTPVVSPVQPQVSPSQTSKNNQGNEGKPASGTGTTKE